MAFLSSHTKNVKDFLKRNELTISVIITAPSLCYQVKVFIRASCTHLSRCLTCFGYTVLTTTLLLHFTDHEMRHKSDK